MIETRGTVIKVEDAFAYVQVQRQTACGGCSKGKEEGGCGISSVAGLLQKKVPLYRADNAIGARVGERVAIGIDEGEATAGALVIYLVPLLLLLAGAVTGNALAETSVARDLFSVLGALIGLAAGFLWLRFHTARMAASGQCQTVILNRLAEGVVINLDREDHEKC